MLSFLCFKYGASFIKDVKAISCVFLRQSFVTAVPVANTGLHSKNTSDSVLKSIAHSHPAVIITHTHHGMQREDE